MAAVLGEKMASPEQTQRFLETNDPDTLKDQLPENAVMLDDKSGVLKEQLPEVPSPDGFLPFIDLAIGEIRARLIKAGNDYGEQVLFNISEYGAVALCYTKASRILWSFNQEKPSRERWDSFLDLAGYAILEMARQQYVKEREGGYTSVEGVFKEHDVETKEESKC